MNIYGNLRKSMEIYEDPKGTDRNPWKSMGYISFEKGRSVVVYILRKNNFPYLPSKDKSIVQKRTWKYSFWGGMDLGLWPANKACENIFQSPLPISQPPSSNSLQSCQHPASGVRSRPRELQNLIYRGCSPAAQGAAGCHRPPQGGTRSPTLCP